MIREITGERELRESVRVIRDSFITVATELNLDISLTTLKSMKERGIRVFGLFQDGRQIGFVAIEKADDNLYYMEKLAVLPEYRHRGFGKMLMDFVFEYVRGKNGEKVSIGIINKNSTLKTWYKAYGFVEAGTQRFERLPFVVCSMEKKVN